MGYPYITYLLGTYIHVYIYTYMVIHYTYSTRVHIHTCTSFERFQRFQRFEHVLEASYLKVVLFCSCRLIPSVPSRTEMCVYTRAHTLCTHAHTHHAVYFFLSRSTVIVLLFMLLFMVLLGMKRVYHD